MEKQLRRDANEGRHSVLWQVVRAALMVTGLALLLASCGARADGGGPILVTARYDEDGDGQFSIDESKPAIYALTLSGDDVEVTRITDPAFWHIGGTVSPDGDRIVYTSWREDTNGDGAIDSSDEVGVYLADLDGSNEVEILGTVGISSGAWSRDGSRFAVQHGTEGEWLIVNADGSGERRLGRDEFYATSFADFDRTISPDGSQRMGMTAEIGWFVVDVDSPPASPEEAEPLTHELPNYRFVSWSPDGTRLLLVVQEERADQVTFEVPLTLYVIKPDGSELTRVTSRGGGGQTARWSPDGKLIAYLTWREDVDGDDIAEAQRAAEDPALYVINTDGSEPQRLLGERYRVGTALGW
jgi:Tol biopolymer transport system component